MHGKASDRQISGIMPCGVHAIMHVPFNKGHQFHCRASLGSRLKLSDDGEELEQCDPCDDCKLGRAKQGRSGLKMCCIHDVAAGLCDCEQQLLHWLKEGPD